MPRKNLNIASMSVVTTLFPTRMMGPTTLELVNVTCLDSLNVKINVKR